MVVRRSRLSSCRRRYRARRAPVRRLRLPSVAVEAVSRRIADCSPENKVTRSHRASTRIQINKRKHPVLRIFAVGATLADAIAKRRW